jgi:hypothetical protein
MTAHSSQHFVVCLTSCSRNGRCQRVRDDAANDHAVVAMVQGSSASARLGGKARYVALVGLGKAAKAQAVAEWGASPFQVSRVCGFGVMALGLIAGCRCGRLVAAGRVRGPCRVLQAMDSAACCLLHRRHAACPVTYMRFDRTFLSAAAN